MLKSFIAIIEGAGDCLHIGMKLLKDQIIGVYEGVVVGELKAIMSLRSVMQKTGRDG